MCGIAGIVRAEASAPVDRDVLEHMAAALAHRGPDGRGLALGSGAGLVSTRLAVVDLQDGWQPMRTDTGVLVYNGEVYNHDELRRRCALPCRTASDTEVVLRLLDGHGPAALPLLNGQFALAWWQPQRRRLLLARDRFGVRPLYFAVKASGDLLFASEPKALFATGEVAAAPDLLGLDDVFTGWGARAPRTAFSGVEQVPPGAIVAWQEGVVVERRSWWEPEIRVEGPGSDQEEVEQLLRDSVRLRLKADVPVGTYLSGGLDSGLLTALAVAESDHPLHTFSLAFTDAAYDESAVQDVAADHLGTRHVRVTATSAAVAEAFRRLVWHAETPMVRTAPVPMMLLAEAVREAGITVVATGEGADELFSGYDVFQEVRLRRAALRGDVAPAALDALYPHLGGAAMGPAWRHALLHAGEPDDPLFSHQPRMAAAQVLRALLRPEVTAVMEQAPSAERLRDALPPEFTAWDDGERTTWLELRTLLEPYLLAAQGDRASMAHGIEGRYPFLDHRLFDAAMRLPARDRLGEEDGTFDEKAVLRRIGKKWLPEDVWRRRKQPYRAPEVAPFFGPATPEWVPAALAPEALDDVGLFDGTRVQRLVQRCRHGGGRSQREAMALVGVLSTQVWSQQHALPARARERAQQPPRLVLDLDDAQHDWRQVG